ncbi:MAG: SprB repeat-containing protein [Bacteroidia bacterium]|nr:SprB repeat-containing protein [Bacteroidia bacterium]
MHINKALTIRALLLLLIPWNIVLSQPANDDLCSSVGLTVGGGCVNGDNTGATTEGLTLPSCFSGNPSNYSHSVWYSFTATDDSITVNFGDGTLGIQVLGVVYGSSDNTCTGTLTELGCKKGGEIKLTGLILGDTYFIMVDGFGTNEGTFCISIYETPPPPPPVGTCDNPRDLFAAGDCNNIAGTQYDEQNNIIWTNTSSGDDDGSTAAGYGNQEGYDGGCADSDLAQNAYWVRFTATVTSAGANSSKTFIDNAGPNTLDYTLFKSAPCTPTACTPCPSPCANLQEVACYSVASGGSQEITVEKDTVYYVMITNSDPNTSDLRYMCLRSGTQFTPPNDDCANGEIATAGVEYTSTNANASPDGSLCSGSTENNVWFSWTAPAGWDTTAYVHMYNQNCACEQGLQLSIYIPSITCTPGGNQSGNCEIVVNPANANDFFGNFTPTPGSTYLINIDGFAGCACEFNFKILSSSILVTGALVADAGTDNTICSSTSDTLGGNTTATGGSGVYGYSWTPSTNLDDSTAANPIASPSSTTTYIVNVTDSASLCTSTDTVIFTVNACGGCTPPEPSGIVTNTSCGGGCTGSIDLTVTGGATPYTYSWSNNATTQDVNSVCAGTYTVTVTENGGCDSIMTFNVTSPAGMTLNMQGSLATCNCPCPGTVWAVPSGGDLSIDGTYDYSWSNGSKSFAQNGICAGTYTVTVTDDQGCIIIGSRTIP